MTVQQGIILWNLQQQGYLLTIDGYFGPEVITMGECQWDDCFEPGQDQEEDDEDLKSEIEALRQSLSFNAEEHGEPMGNSTILHFYDAFDENKVIPVTTYEFEDIKVWGPQLLNVG